jgi:glycerol-1-phosphate dehydrogenase [NAD(P)+]
MTVKEALAKASDTLKCLVGEGVVAETVSVAREVFPDAKKIVIIADPRTWAAAGEKVEALFANAGYETKKHILEPDGKIFHAEYSYIAEVKDAIVSCSEGVLPVAVGSGVVNDLVKRASGELGVGYLVVATAASVDGYSSFGASLSSPEGAKQTYACPAPKAIIADIDIMRTAPKEMASYGFADLMAKSPAGADWILAAELGATEWHEDAWHIVQDSLGEAIGDAEGVAKAETAALTRFVEGLMLGGFAMQAMQSSRPASGAEHMFSHILDMTHHSFNGDLVSHGAQVGVFTLFMTRFHEALLDFDMNSLDVDECVERWPEWNDAGEALVRDVFKDSDFPMLGIEQSKPKWETKEALRETLTKAKSRWGEISERLRRQLVPSSEIERRLKVVNAPSCPKDIGVDNDFIERNILFAMFMRNRYNALDFAYRIGKLHEFAAKACAPWKTEK